jgi:hypothetical protein
VVQRVNRFPGLIIVSLLVCGCSKEPPPSKLESVLSEVLGDAGTLFPAVSQPKFAPPPKPMPPAIRPKTGPLLLSNIKVGQSSISVSAIVKNIRRRQGALLQCYLRTLLKNPKGQGTVIVQFTLDERGHVGETRVRQDPIGNGLSGCILSRFKRFRFPKEPDPTGQMEVHLGFSL